MDTTYTRYTERNQEIAHSLNGGLIMKTIAKVVKTIVEVILSALYNDGNKDSFKERS